MLIVLMLAFGAVVGACAPRLLLPVMVRARQRAADEDARFVAFEAAVESGTGERDAWKAAAGVAADLVTGPVIVRVDRLRIGMALATGVLCAVFAAVLPVALLPLFAYLSIVGVMLAVADARLQVLPNELVLGSYPMVAALLAVGGLLSGEWPIVQVLGSGAAWWGFFALVFVLTAGRGMGLGDVKLAPLLGVALGTLGWQVSFIGWFAGLLIGALVMMTQVSIGRARMVTPLPYGPSMLAGGIVGVLAGDAIWAAWLGSFGLA